MRLVSIGKNTFENAVLPACGVLTEGFKGHNVGFIRGAEYSKRNYWVPIKTREEAKCILAVGETALALGLITSGNGRVFKAMREAAREVIDETVETAPEPEPEPESAPESKPGKGPSEPYAPRDTPKEPPPSPEYLFDYKKLRGDVLGRTEACRTMFDQLFADQVKEIKSLRRYLGRIIDSFERSGEIPQEYLDWILKHHPEVLEYRISKGAK